MEEHVRGWHGDDGSEEAKANATPIFRQGHAFAKVLHVAMKTKIGKKSLNQILLSIPRDGKIQTGGWTVWTYGPFSSGFQSTCQNPRSSI